MSYFEQVAKMLGVEIGEEFKVVSESGFNNNNFCKFENDGLYYSRDSKTWNEGTFNLYRLIAGTDSVVKVPWIPEPGDIYFTIVYLPELISDQPYDKLHFIGEFTWCYTDDTISKMALGLCFRTQKEAIEALPLVKAKVKRVLDGGKWEEEKDGE